MNKKVTPEVSKETPEASNKKSLDNEEKSGLFSIQTVIYIVIGIIIILVVSIAYFILCKSRKSYEERQPDDASMDDIINHNNSQIGIK